MAIQRLSVHKAAESAAEKNFRSLPEVENYLKDIKERLSDLDELIKSFQAQFAKSERAWTKDPEVAAPFSFKVNFEGLDTQEQRKKIDIKTKRLDKVVIPNPDALRKNFDVLIDLYDQYETLQNVYNSVATTLKGVGGSVQTLKNIKAMMSSAQAKITKGLEFLKAVGEKYSPKAFTQLVESTISLVEEGLDFQSYENYLYATENAHKELQFTHYVHLHNLLDNDGAQIPNFFIVFTCILRPEGKEVVPEFYVTVMHEFQLPGTFDPGKQISNSKTAQTAVFTLFHLENVSHSLGVLPHNIDPAKLTRDKFSVAKSIKGVEATPDKITFILLKDTPKKAIPEITGLLYNELKAKITGRMKNARLKARVTRTEAGYAAIEFTLMNLAENDQVSVHDLDYLRQVLKVDDMKMRQIVKIINS